MRLSLALLLVAGVAQAKTITVGPSDSFLKIEAAQPGDVVEIAPGTYKFRVDFETAGSAAQPIVVRAQDPGNRPVWDLTGTMVSSAPGSYTAGDKGRGCWQFHAGHYLVDGIVFKGCVDHSSAGIRVVNVPDVTIRNCRFVGNTNGITGAGEPITVEFSEFDGNGQALAGDQPAHQMYIYGGTLAVRFSYLHDSPAGQDFHVRALKAVLEYNWITRPATYLGDLMSCEYLCGSTGTQPITQSMLLRGNVLVQGTPQNTSQLIALFNDEPNGSVDGSGAVDTMDVTLVSNTIAGTGGATNEVVHLRNDTVRSGAHLTDNAIVSFRSAVLVEAPGALNATVDGQGNWLSSGTDVGTLDKSTFGADPMLTASYRPAAGSPLIGAAVDPGGLAPQDEYFRDEKVTLEGRARATVKDVGAFESTTNSPPFDGHSGPGGGSDGGVAGDGGGGGGSTGTLPAGGGVQSPQQGCACTVGGAALDNGAIAWLLLVAGLAARLMRRSARR